MTTATARRILVELYDTDAQTRLAVLENAQEAAWHDVLSRQGYCSFALPRDDPKRSQLTDFRFVRMSWNGLAFGHRLSPEQTWQHSDTKGRVVYTGPGLGELLNDAVLWPEYPETNADGAFDVNTEDARGFGPYSKAGDWMTSDAGWLDPEVLRWDADSGRRSRRPRIFGKIAPRAAWIAPVGLYVDVPDGSVFWARKTVDLDDATDCVLVYTGDNYVDVWVDGRLVGMSDSQLYGWRKAKRIELRLPGGPHVICARVENAKTTSGANPYGFIAALCTTDSEGKPDRVIAKTGPGWNVHEGDPEPGWYPINVLHRFYAEALDRDVKGMLTMDIGFTTTEDSDEVALSGDRVTFERPLGMPGAEFAAALAPLGFDWHVDWPAGSRPILNAHLRRGASRTSGSNTVKLFLPQGLKDYDTKRNRVRRTALLGQRANGRWVERTSGVGAAGRMETSASVSAAGSEGTLRQLVNTLLRRSAAAQIESRIGGQAFLGPQPGSGYDPLGDTIWVPGHAGLGHHKARCLGVSVAQVGDRVVAYPLFTADGSEA